MSIKQRRGSPTLKERAPEKRLSIRKFYGHHPPASTDVNVPVAAGCPVPGKRSDAGIDSRQSSAFVLLTFAGWDMQLDALRRDIEYRRRQIHRQRREILELQRLGIPSRSAEELLERMLARVDELCAERDRLRASEQRTYAGTTKAIRGAQRR
jgi:hypothetical protein